MKRLLTLFPVVGGLIAIWLLLVAPQVIAAVVVTIITILAIVAFVVAAFSDYYLHRFVDWYEAKEGRTATSQNTKETNCRRRKRKAG